MRLSVAVCMALMTFVFVERSEGHGYLRDPPSRSSMWREGFNVPKNYNDNALNCGGNRRKCGVCGDPPNAPQENIAGGTYATGTISRHYTEGQTIKTTQVITANHGGWIEFHLCVNNDVDKKVTEQCFMNNVLKLANGQSRYQLQKGVTGPLDIDVVLPQGVTCSQCVIRWKWMTGNSWGTDSQGNSCVGCGNNQEQFYGCSDVRIAARGSGSPAVTAAPTPRPTGYPIQYPTNAPYNPYPQYTQAPAAVITGRPYNPAVTPVPVITGRPYNPLYPQNTQAPYNPYAQYTQAPAVATARPYNPYNPAVTGSPYNPYNTQAPFNPYNPYLQNTQRPYNPYQPQVTQTPYNPYRPQVTQAPFNPYNPYPQNTQAPYNPYQPQVTQSPYNPYRPQTQAPYNPFLQYTQRPVTANPYNPLYPVNTQRPYNPYNPQITARPYNPLYPQNTGAPYRPTPVPVIYNTGVPAVTQRPYNPIYPQNTGAPYRPTPVPVIYNTGAPVTQRPYNPYPQNTGAPYRPTPVPVIYNTGAPYNPTQRPNYPTAAPVVPNVVNPTAHAGVGPYGWKPGQGPPTVAPQTARPYIATAAPQRPPTVRPVVGVPTARPVNPGQTGIIQGNTVGGAIRSCHAIGPWAAQPDMKDWCNNNCNNNNCPPDMCQCS